MKGSSLGLAFVLSGLTLLAACGESSSPENSDSCDDPVCCAPVEFDAARSRVYLVDGQLQLYLATKGEVYAPGQPPAAWENTGEFEAEVRSTATETTACDDWAETSGSGLNGQYCAASAAREVSCGEEVVFDVRLHSTFRNPDTGESLCDGAPFNIKVTWAAAVLCPQCPANSFPGQVCDHPPSLECSYSASGNSFCGPSIVRLPCRCEQRFDTGERAWTCWVC